MLYIYKILPTPFIAKCASDAQMMHKYLCGLIHASRNEANLLYKLDVEHSCLFVQSDIQPDEAQFFKLLYKMDIDHVLSKKMPQDEIHFRLTTDTHMKKTTNGITKKIYVPHDKIAMWLTEKLQRNGVDVHSIRELGKRNVTFLHSNDRGGYANVTTYEFDIRGAIVNTESLRNAWHKGMGEHKAYGNGLFLLCR